MVTIARKSSKVRTTSCQNGKSAPASGTKDATVDILKSLRAFCSLGACSQNVSEKLALRPAVVDLGEIDFAGLRSEQNLRQRGSSLPQKRGSGRMGHNRHTNMQYTVAECVDWEVPSSRRETNSNRSTGVQIRSKQLRCESVPKAERSVHDVTAIAEASQEHFPGSFCSAKSGPSLSHSARLLNTEGCIGATMRRVVTNASMVDESVHANNLKVAPYGSCTSSREVASVVVGAPCDGSDVQGGFPSLENKTLPLEPLGDGSKFETSSCTAAPNSSDANIDAC